MHVQGSGHCTSALGNHLLALSPAPVCIAGQPWLAFLTWNNVFTKGVTLTALIVKSSVWVADVSVLLGICVMDSDNCPAPGPITVVRFLSWEWLRATRKNAKFVVLE
jgi:hypothetical protein